MDASSGSVVSDDSIHVYNFSPLAIRTYIFEVKKYPIIYNGNRIVCNGNTLTSVPNALIDFAWTRIVEGLLNNNQNLDVTRRNGYWDRSFRELWKWMRSLLIKDMLLRKNKGVEHIRSSEHNWLEYLKFLEPYIELSGELLNESGMDSHLDSNIHIQIQSPGAFLNIVASNPIVIWLRSALEHVNSETMYISIWLRTPADVSIDFNKKLPQFGELFKPVASNFSKIINHRRDPIGFDAANPQGHISSTSSQNGQVVVPFRANYQIGRNVEHGAILPLQKVAVSTPVDEDFQCIMSLLPTLQEKELEPRGNSDMKVLIIQTLNELL